MGSVTHQYSAEELIEMYQAQANRYKPIADELEHLMTTEYIKRIKIKIFLKEHLQFCNETISVLEDAVKEIKGGNVDECICLRLESLFGYCAEEHRKLEDTYSRVRYEQSSDFTLYELVHCKLREECDGMSFFDETIKFVRTMISNKNNRIVFCAPVSGVQIQQDTVDSSQKQDIEKQQEIIVPVGIDIEKEKVTIKNIFKEKIFELIVVITLVIIAKVISGLRYTEIFSSINIGVQLFLMVFSLVCWIGGAVYGIALLFDWINIIRIRKEGNFVEFVSKKEILRMILTVFGNKDESKEIRNVGKTYKNIEGYIYFIKHKICPYCQTEPIGKMYLIKDVQRRKYQWVCSEQWSHKVDFDYKKEF